MPNANKKSLIILIVRILSFLCLIILPMNPADVIKYQLHVVIMFLTYFLIFAVFVCPKYNVKTVHTKYGFEDELHERWVSDFLFSSISTP